jgi:hypothetical protein
MTAISVAASLAKTLYSYLDDDGRLLIPATSQEHADEIVARIREARRLVRDPSQMWPRTPSGSIDVETALPALARRFPSLCTGIPGIEPWNPTALLRWLVLGGDSYAAALAAKFVLGAWRDIDWQQIANDDEELLAEYRALRRDAHCLIILPRFNLFEAMRVWDHAHLAAMLSWVQSPFSTNGLAAEVLRHA